MGKGDHSDLEAAAAAAFPPAYMIESPQLRWAFIRKVYALVAMQLLATVAVASAVYFVPAIRRFFAARTPAAVAALVAIIVAPIILVLPMVFLRKWHPINLVLLALFTVAMSLAVGLGCLSRKGIIIIEAASLTLVAVVGLTLYTFWAARRGHDFSFLGPFLAAACLILMLYWLAQMLLPMGSVATTVYGCVVALVFSGFIIYDTDNLIKRHGYDEYVMAAISLYLDTVNIFMAIVNCMSSSDP
ncbi:BI1-like protein isoform X2 [Panicum miliaceum]|uniref:BI1-like protein isoform X2 n=1 Tax=Panicum miliaceum TaxID=4540 RepID=A0A3L6TBR5_PANMI|nr:BI1-like protein isoform X2 [Panicum miliaceum]